MTSHTANLASLGTDRRRPQSACGARSRALNSQSTTASRADMSRQSTRVRNTPNSSIGQLMEQDPQKAINDFDKRLAELTAMLSRYKEEVIHDENTDGKQHKNLSGLLGDSKQHNRKKGKGRKLTEEEAFLNEKIHRRIKSAGPGASRALSTRVHTYRNDPIQRAELNQRCQEHVKVIKQETVQRRESLNGGNSNFIRLNQASLRQSPEPVLERALTLTSRPFRSSLSAKSASIPWHAPNYVSCTHATPSSMHAQPLIRSITIEARNGVLLNKDYAPSTPHNQLQQHPHSTTTQPTFITNMYNTTSRTGSSDTQRDGANHTAVSDPAHASQNDTYTTSNHTAWPSQRSSTPDGTISCSTRPSTAMRRPMSARPVSPPEVKETLKAMRDARLVVTSRPASGGSPTRRQEFIEQRHMLAAQHASHAEDVRQRHEESLEMRQLSTEQQATLRAQRKLDEQLKREEALARQEAATRAQQWSGIVTLAYKLEFMKQEIIASRQLKPLRELRREAAIKIASWYKRVLEKRQMDGLMALAKRVSVIAHTRIPAIKQKARTRCAHRLVEFLRTCNEGVGATSAVAAVQNFRERLMTIQQAWRTILFVRKTQRAMLYAHFLRFEKSILARNTKDSKLLDSMVRSPARQSLGHMHGHGSLTNMGTYGELHGDGLNGPQPGALLSFAGKSRKAAEVEDPVLEALLATHKHLLPKDIRTQVVEHGLKELRLKFARQMQGYRAAMQLYNLQLPIEKLRMRLLADAGLAAVPHLKKPAHPVMLVLLPRPGLKRLLQYGMTLQEDQKMAAQNERRKLVEQLWLQNQANKCQLGLPPAMQHVPGLLPTQDEEPAQKDVPQTFASSETAEARCRTASHSQACTENGLDNRLHSSAEPVSAQEGPVSQGPDKGLMEAQARNVHASKDIPEPPLRGRFLPKST